MTNLQENNARLEAEISDRQATAEALAHEINQPLNSIKMISSGCLLLIEQGKEMSAEQFVENLREISLQTDVISKIISRLRTGIHKDEGATAPCDSPALDQQGRGTVDANIACR